MSGRSTFNGVNLPIGPSAGTINHGLFVWSGRSVLVGQGHQYLWYTDHKGLIHLLNQWDLSGRQARWLEKVSECDFEVIYVPGAENILSDALSCLYSNNEPGTVRTSSKYTYHDVIDNDVLSAHVISMPVLVGKEGKAASMRKRRGRMKPEPAETGRPAPMAVGLCLISWTNAVLPITQGMEVSRLSRMWIDPGWPSTV